eukprot:TRINITY_DN126_c0_g1_i2.p1 TRINITY_DN126_c0_g1~~TRINITY_DN126_c0_g1_i2.p1  ORF type:complete len:776 (-),score=232.97 TRINITY_DN126_c0_g1_i2:56-2383(-)
MAVTTPPLPERKTRKQRSAPKAIPAGVSLADIFNSLPKDVFAQDKFKAYSSIFASVFWICLSAAITSRLPWFIKPIGWLLSGISITGLFAIAHDCMHGSFAKSKLVNDIVGTLVLLPLGYSFLSAKTHHKYQAAAAAPRTPALKATAPLLASSKGYTFWLRSVANWMTQTFDVNMYRTEDQTRVRIGLVLVAAFAALFVPSMWSSFGLLGLFNYWLLPLVAYHVVLATVNLLPSVLFEGAANLWVHCEYPQLFEFVTHDIGIMLPRQISSSIPHYNLRKAYIALKQNWGDYIHECTFDSVLLHELIAKSQNIPPHVFSPFTHVPCVTPFRAAFNAEGLINPVKLASEGFAKFVANTREFMAGINWLHAAILIPTPVIALYGLVYVTPSSYTIAWALFYYWCTGMGITAGYHRLWSHKAYTASFPLKMFLLAFGSGAVQGSVRWWCRDHRAHHRYTDTDADPYSAHKGFFYSHIGWMLMKQNPDTIGRASIEDLNQDPWIRWQHRHYVPISVVMGVLLPSLVCGLWGDLYAGYFYAGVLRLVLVHHATFFVNSLAHYWGEISYADHHTPRDSILTALLTFGEGYHNFHHEFPHDYRNAIFFWQYDPTKWFIKAMEMCGLASNLKVFSQNEVMKGRVQMSQKMLDKKAQDVDWGFTPAELPLYTKQTLADAVAQGRKLLVCEGIVHDVATFVEEHPGGRAFIDTAIGKDITNNFNGGVYEHSNGARNLLAQMRVGRVDPEEFPFKRSHLSWEGYVEASKHTAHHRVPPSSLPDNKEN